jgi:glycosyltransferase involved in cell wall biosynthesis
MRDDACPARPNSDITTVILTHNEELHIARAIQSVIGFSHTVFVVDSFSTDATCEIAGAAGAIVTQHPFLTQSEQLKWALRSLPITTQWVLRLDADEILSDKLKAEIEVTIPSIPDSITGVYLRLRYIFMGRKLLYGGRSLQLLRLFRVKYASVTVRWMDERIEQTSGDSVVFDNFMYDYNLKDISFFVDKHNKYSKREAIEVLRQRYGLWDVAEASRTTINSGRIKNFVKTNFYSIFPLWMSSLGYFIYRYVILLGFADGREGLIYHIFQGLWYRFLVGAKIEEYDRVLRTLAGRESRIVELGRLTGYPLVSYVQQFSNEAP